MLDDLTPERWRRIRDVAGAVLDADPSQREATLHRECGGDLELREAAGQIVRQYSETDDLLGHEPFHLAPPESEELVAGERIGAYRIERELGRGSMGRVYLAQRADEVISKTVAIKVLRFRSSTLEVLFRGERRILAGLEHAHIARLHDAGDSDGRLYLVMEYVAGSPLDAHCRETNLPRSARLRLFRQICDAVDYAHRQGVRHGDLKPSNILVDASGSPKLLDFGVAALAGEAAPGYTRRYASPELQTGAPADERADIYSLGVILGDLLADAPVPADVPVPADAPVPADVPVPADAPVPADVPVPADLASIVARARAADPDARYATARQLSEDVERFLTRRPVQAHPGGWSYRTAKFLRRQPWVPAVAAAVALAGAVEWATRPEALPAARQVNRLTVLGGREAYPSLVPGGQAVAFASRRTGNWDIFVQGRPEEQPRNLTADSPADDLQPAYSPDGRQIAFRSEREGGGLFVMQADGRGVRRLSAVGFHPAWSPDGRQIAYSTVGFVRMRATTYLRRGQLGVIDVATGQTRALTSDQSLEDAVQPVWSPDGRELAFWGIDRQGATYIYRMAAEGGTPVVVIWSLATKGANGRVWSPFWSASGRYLYYNSDAGGTSTLWRVAADGRGAPVRVPLPVAEAGFFSLSRDGQRLAYTVDTESWNIEKLGFDPARRVTVGEPLPITTGENSFVRPRVSPDGRALVFESTTSEDIWLCATDGSGLRRLAGGITGVFPRFVDPNTIGFIERGVKTAQTPVRYTVVTLGLDGGRRTEWTSPDPEPIGSIKWLTPQRLILSQPNRGRFLLRDLARPEPEAVAAALPPLHTLSFSGSATGNVRLLGRLIPLKRREDARAMIFDLATHTVTDLGLRVDDAIELFDGERYLLYKSKDHVLRLLDRRTHEDRELHRFGTDELVGMDLSPDRRWLYFGRAKAAADVWVADLDSPL